MTTRIQVLLAEDEKERLQAQARRDGLPLSTWLRRVALERLETQEAGTLIRSEEDLHAFFGDCDAREKGREPDWEEHRAVIERSVASGASDT